MQIMTLEPIARENLIILATSYRDLTQHTMGTVGRYAHSDPGFFKDLIVRHAKWQRDGEPDRVEDDRKGSFTFRVYDKVLAWFKDNWPPDADFPRLTDLTHKPKRHRNGTTKGIKKSAKGSGRGGKAKEAKEGSEGGGTGATLARLRGDLG